VAVVADSGSDRRTLGLAAATGIGVGAIVGGGILALAGVAFATTGPSAVLAFALNGVIALVTALSFAELSSRFPQSGGTYTYARKVLSIEAAFAVGWVVWFASVAAAVLYALGFAVFLVPLLEQLVRMVGAEPPEWIGGRFALLTYALGALGFYTAHLMHARVGGGQWPTIGKVVVFTVLIAGGVWGIVTDPPPIGELASRFTPFFDRGVAGLVQAMGYTFIALQGFDLIAAVGGEVKDPERNIPRAMLLSLGAALLIYVPLLLLLVAAGSPDRSITALASENPEILVAAAAQGFLGSVGYWLVVVAAVLSMLSALQANLMAASSFASTMASDRTLPAALAGSPEQVGVAPAAAKLTAATIAVVLVAVPDVAGAGAASSLIFLVTFTLVHGISYLARKRATRPSPFRTVAFPVVPLVGGASCLALGLFQALAVPSAGVLMALWLSAGAVLYVTTLAPRARVVDASSEGFDPQLIQLRGRTPLLLVPIANPEHASKLVKVAEAIAPQGITRIRLLTVVSPHGMPVDGELPPPLIDAQRVLGGALATAVSGELRPEALVTISDDPWSEIARIALRSRTDTVLLGVGEAGRSLMDGPLEKLIGLLPSDVVVLRAPLGWDPDAARKILVPSRLGREQSPIRARLLGNLCRTAGRDVEFLGVLPPGATPAEVRRASRALRRLAHDEVLGGGTATVVQRDDVAAEVIERAARCDLMILGLEREHRRGGVFGERTLEIAEGTRCPLLMISRRG
jgi:APA family basic amino acid/polyamine antiporter